MYNFILQIIVMASLGALVYLVARTIPRISENNNPVEAQDNVFEKFIKKIPFEKADAFVTLLFEKFLRRAKIVILKVDNFLAKHLQNLRPTNQRGGAAEKSLFENKEEKKE